ncbi:MAG: transglycosylase domain-containing protein, partial [Armatimonadetes bacterium]|nr:transglycosylase domain-containing protein [Anaerolineae bacterium]
MASTAHIIRRRRNRKARRAAAQTRQRNWLYLLLTLLFLGVGLPLSIVLGTTAVVYAQETATLPQPGDTLDLSAMAGATELYDRSGQTLLYTVQDPLGDNRTWLRLDDLPPYVAQATLLVEDPDFYTARFDPLRMVTRLWRNLLAGPIEPERSITGRLVRNAIATPPEVARISDRTREIALVAALQSRYTSQQLLEWHLNTNDYGGEAYGIEAAAQVYLGKSARALTLDE